MATCRDVWHHTVRSYQWYVHLFSMPATCLTNIVSQDSSLYFQKVKEARSLQDRWRKEAGVDVVERVTNKLRQNTGMKVQVAREGDDEYFAGILRAVDRGIGVHADYAPYVSAISVAIV